MKEAEEELPALENLPPEEPRGPTRNWPAYHKSREYEKEEFRHPSA